ncbi:unnamed protein product [Discula destructiva]
MATSKDILVTMYSGAPDKDWEKDLIQRCDGKLEIRWHDNLMPDGSLRGPSDYDSAILDGATMLYTYAPVAEDLMPNLRFVQLSSAGSDLWAKHPKYLDKNVKFCTTSGSNAAQIAEWVVGTWLRFSHSFPQYDEQQKQCVWKTLPIDDVQDSVGARVGILGYGAIGRQVARVCTALGMEILAFTSTPRTTPASRRHSAFNLPHLGDPDGELPSQWLHGKTRADVDHFLAQDLDLLVVALPLTPTTKNLLGAAQFDILSKKRTFVVNIARGAIVDQDALVEALEAGKIRGAAVDVTEPEPLPADHALWRARNCFVTPHVAWHSRSQLKRCLGILGDNVDKFSKGEALLNELKR